MTIFYIRDDKGNWVREDQHEKTKKFLERVRQLEALDQKQKDVTPTEDKTYERVQQPN